jgi:hypothetical protein
MADRSQHPRQIMETQTRYDLNAAMENWRTELAAQTGLTADDRRELETHLRDAIVGFQQRGLNDEECFWLACRRIGQPRRLRKEYVKANPAVVWRERFFWTAVILLTVRAWAEISLVVTSLCRGMMAHFYIVNNHHFFPAWIQQFLPFTQTLDSYAFQITHTSSGLNAILEYLTMLPVVGIVFLLCCGKLGQRFLWIQKIFSSRRRFLSLILPVFSVYFLLVGNATLEYVSGRGGVPSSAVALKELIDLVYITLLIAAVAWLMPSQNQKILKHA